MKKLKSLFVNGIVKDSKNNMEKYLFNENERLNAIIDELEERIDKAIEYLKQEAFLDYEQIKELLEILGNKEIEEIPQFKGTLEELDNLTLGDK